MHQCNPPPSRNNLTYKIIKEKILKAEPEPKAAASNFTFKPIKRTGSITVFKDTSIFSVMLGDIIKDLFVKAVLWVHIHYGTGIFGFGSRNLS